MNHCKCWFHRYHIVHIWREQIYDHSQGTWNGVLKLANEENIESYPSHLYEHGMTASELRKAFKVFRMQEKSDRNEANEV
ncbi:MAG: hypothetical protein EHM45_23960 [Desulfobacteraceae bacterium]|nr:MAG: hypothetical protein EHM45_23960 [Desulfobacteraceae bacterium]